MNYLKYSFWILALITVSFFIYDYSSMKLKIKDRDIAIEMLNESLITQYKINEDDLNKQKFDLDSKHNKEKIEMRLEYNEDINIDINSTYIYL